MMRTPSGMYGREDGFCEACHVTMKGHPICEACGLLLGDRHESEIKNFRDHILCEYCTLNWFKAERKQKRELTWREFYTRGLERERK